MKTGYLGTIESSYPITEPLWIPGVGTLPVEVGRGSQTLHHYRCACGHEPKTIPKAPEPFFCSNCQQLIPHETMDKITVNCPCGNAIELESPAEVSGLECTECRRTVTWCNTRTGEIHDWSTREETQAANDAFAAELQSAEDNSYFGADTGW